MSRARKILGPFPISLYSIRATLPFRRKRQLYHTYFSLDATVLDAQETPVIVFARLMKGGLPVLQAGLTVDVSLPGEFPHASVGDTTSYQLQLRDDGLGK